MLSDYRRILRCHHIRGPTALSERDPYTTFHANRETDHEFGVFKKYPRFSINPWKNDYPVRCKQRLESKCKRLNARKRARAQARNNDELHSQLRAPDAATSQGLELQHAPNAASTCILLGTVSTTPSWEIRLQKPF